MIVKSETNITKNKVKDVGKIKDAGITMIALVVTIVVLLILASITIGAVTSENGILRNANDAKEQTEIAEEKEIVDRATIQAMGNNKRGNIVEDELQEQLDKITGNGKTEADDVGEEFEVAFIESKRYYTVDKDGTVTGPQEIVEDKSPGDITKDENGDDLKGDEDQPYEIWCIEDLVAFSIMTNGGDDKLSLDSNNFDGKYVILARTLNFNSAYSYNDYTTNKFGDVNTDGVIEDLKTELIKTEDSCIGFKPINNFEGNFDGKENEIQNIYINTEEKATLMLKAKSIKNIGITGNITSTGSSAAGICHSSPIVENCWNKANIIAEGDANMAGSAAGVCNFSLTMQNCYNIGKVMSTVRNVRRHNLTDLKED